MRRLIASVNISLDGFTAGPDGELDWHFKCWDAGMAKTLCLYLHSADTILLGRKTYEALAAYWPDTINDPGFPREDLPLATLMNDRRKIVFSNQQVGLSWEQSSQLSGNLSQRITRLKDQPGSNIIIFGSVRLVQALLQLKLIDGLLLWVHPVVLGSGCALFDTDIEKMLLEGVEVFTSGVVQQCYSVVG
jgi:dihydrofolate reductase